ARLMLAFESGTRSLSGSRRRRRTPGSSRLGPSLVRVPESLEGRGVARGWQAEHLGGDAALVGACGGDDERLLYLDPRVDAGADQHVGRLALEVVGRQVEGRVEAVGGLAEA